MPPTKDPMDRIERMFRLLKLVGGLVIVGVTGVGAVFIWVNGQSHAVASMQESISGIQADTRGRLSEWSGWRMRKDEIDTRLITLLEEMQKNQERLTTRLERVEARP